MKLEEAQIPSETKASLKEKEMWTTLRDTLSCESQTFSSFRHCIVPGEAGSRVRAAGRGYRGCKMFDAVAQMLPWGCTLPIVCTMASSAIVRSEPKGLATRKRFISPIPAVSQRLGGRRFERGACGSLLGFCQRRS